MEEESMSREYFQTIVEQLSEVAGAARANEAVRANEDRIEQLTIDVEILEVFCFCIQIWEVSIDEESMERLTSVNTSLKAIWPTDFTLLLSLLPEQMGGCERRPIDVCIHDFDTVMLELEGMILQSKQLLEGWCRNSMIHSSMIEGKFTELQWDIILRSVKDIQTKLISSRYRDGKKFPLKKQIDILSAKIEFLHLMPFSDGKEINDFLNFIGNFAYNAAWLTFLYWAKEDDDETASEMNIVLFDMLHKFIPYAYYITPLYVGILKSDDMQPTSNSFLFGEAVESFVDFFFDHLAIILKDDFLFLRDRLMFLFTFLPNPPFENIAEEEGDLIRSQVNAILHQDVYILLCFDEMKQDFSDKKALFSAFMIRIDIVIVKIKQLYRRSSDSWITMEAEKLEYNYLVCLHRELSSIEKHAKGAAISMEQIQLYKMELKPMDS